MPKFARQARLSREHEELALDMLLDGMPLPPEAPQEMTALPPMLAELSGPAGPSELAGEMAVLSRFRRHLSQAGISSRRMPERRMPSWQSPARRAQLAAALAVLVIGAGATAAAYTGALPTPVQELAYHVIGAPPPSSPARHPGKITRKAPHRHAPPPDGRGPAGAGGPPGQRNHPAPPGQRSRPAPPRAHHGHHGHHKGWRHGLPPGQLGKTGPAVRALLPGGGQHPAHPGHPADPAGPKTGHNPSAWGRRTPPGHATLPGHTAGPGHPAHGPPARARSHAR
jgi:hypothetical protein